jgi:hypothetical protein
MTINQTDIDRLRAYALKHYTTGGWDHLVEAWTDDEIREEVERYGWSTYTEMFEGFAEMFELITEQHLNQRAALGDYAHRTRTMEGF